MAAGLVARLSKVISRVAILDRSMRIPSRASAARHGANWRSLSLRFGRGIRRRVFGHYFSDIVPGWL